MDKNISIPIIENVPCIVNIHLQAFPGFFLSSLGKKFLTEYYNGFITTESGIIFVYSEKGEILGFVAGSSQPNGFYSRMIIRRLFPFTLSALPIILRNPTLLPHILRAFQNPEKRELKNNIATLFSISVLPSCQGKGIGKKLVLEFIKEVEFRKLSHVNLTTDKFNNVKVNQFYQKIGFSYVRSFSTPEGRVMNEYEIKV